MERRTFTGIACEAALRNFGCRCYGRGNQHAQKMDAAVGASFGGRKPAGHTRGGGWASAGDQVEISRTGLLCCCCLIPHYWYCPDCRSVTTAPLAVWLV